MTVSAAPAECPQCGTHLGPALLSCPQCRWLVHGTTLKQLAAEAEQAESSGDLATAAAKWQDARQLLPPDSRQAETIAARVQSLGERMVKSPAGRPKAPAWVTRASGISGVLPDGNYRATLLAAGITNTNGQPLGANHIFNFFFLNGDADRDGRANLNDFNILAANFGQSPRDFTQGDFDFDMLVNLNDFNILAGRFGQVLAGPDGFGSSPIRGTRDGDELRKLLEELT